MQELYQLTKNLVAELKVKGIECHIHHKATTGSAYIRFKDPRMGSIRISDHAGRSKLKYKFNIRSDFSNEKPQWMKDRGIWRLYISSKHYQNIIPEIIKRAEIVKTWKVIPYNKTPKHGKRNKKI